jgi:hypothetical protein
MDSDKIKETQEVSMNIAIAFGVGILAFLVAAFVFALASNGLLFALIIGVGSGAGYYFSTQNKSRSDP